MYNDPFLNAPEICILGSHAIKNPHLQIENDAHEKKDEEKEEAKTWQRNP